MTFTRSLFHIRTVGKWDIPKGMFNESSLHFYSVHSHIHSEEIELIEMQIDCELGRTIVLKVKRP